LGRHLGTSGRPEARPDISRADVSLASDTMGPGVPKVHLPSTLTNPNSISPHLDLAPPSRSRPPLPTHPDPSSRYRRRLPPDRPSCSSSLKPPPPASPSLASAAWRLALPAAVCLQLTLVVPSAVDPRPLWRRVRDHRSSLPPSDVECAAAAELRFSVLNLGDGCDHGLRLSPTPPTAAAGAPLRAYARVVRPACGELLRWGAPGSIVGRCARHSPA
jgi:hypothetical protein